MRDAREQGRQYRAAALVTSGVLTLAFSVVIGFVGGYYLDRWLHTGPWLVLIFGMMGVVAGFRELIRLISRAGEEEDRNRAAGAAKNPPPSEQNDERD